MKLSHVMFHMIVISLVFFSKPVLAQTCGEEEITDVISCIDTASGDCFAIQPGCASEDVLDFQARDSILEQVEVRCCNRSSNEERIACLKTAQADLRKARGLLSSVTRFEVRRVLKMDIKNLKNTGDCAG